MGARAVLRGAAELGLVLAGDLARWGGQKIVGFLFSAPTVEERFSANPGLPEDYDDDEEELLTPAEQELEELQRERAAMASSRRSPPPEDNPSNEVLVGSREWRRQQREGFSR